MSNQEATFLNSSDAPSGRRLDDVETIKQQYHRLSRLNDPEWDGPWRDKNQTTERDHKNLVDAVASSLSLTSYQKGRARELIDSLPENHFRGNRNVVVTLVVCGYVGHKDGRPYHYNTLRQSRERLNESGLELVDFARESGVTFGEYAKCWERVVPDIEQ